MPKNPISDLHTNCPHCGAETKSLQSRICSSCAKRLTSERGLKIESSITAVVKVIACFIGAAMLIWMLSSMWLSRK